VCGSVESICTEHFAEGPHTLTDKLVGGIRTERADVLVPAS